MIGICCPSELAIYHRVKTLASLYGIEMEDVEPAQVAEYPHLLVRLRIASAVPFWTRDPETSQEWGLFFIVKGLCLLERNATNQNKDLNLP
jgi:hypothetical protein